MTDKQNELNNFFWFTTTTLSEQNVVLYETFYEEDGSVKTVNFDKAVEQVDSMQSFLSTLKEQLLELSE